MSISLIDLSFQQPTLVPADAPDISDDECVRRLAKAVEDHDSAHLDEVVRLIGRLAVTIE
ncbi:MAG: hypothetical protein V7632_4676 [Bradyrhizobium sp.]|jgi:hypothetical protein